MRPVGSARLGVPEVTGHEHYARYDFARDGLYCPGCGRTLLGNEVLDRTTGAVQS